MVNKPLTKKEWDELINNCKKDITKKWSSFKNKKLTQKETEEFIVKGLLVGHNNLCKKMDEEVKEIIRKQRKRHSNVK